MNESTLRALVENGAIKKVRIIGSGATFHIELIAAKEPIIAQTNAGAASLDSAAKWLKRLGIGTAEINVGQWQPGQKRLAI